MCAPDWSIGFVSTWSGDHGSLADEALVERPSRWHLIGCLVPAEAPEDERPDVADAAQGRGWHSLED